LCEYILKIFEKSIHSLFKNSNKSDSTGIGSSC